MGLDHLSDEELFEELKMRYDTYFDIGIYGNEEMILKGNPYNLEDGDRVIVLKDSLN